MSISNFQFPISNSRARSASRHEQAFTLIEMLVVIAIIGILAALIVGLTGSSGATKVRSRVKTELAALETVIGKYHKEFGFYPQDHSQMPPALAPWSTNQLTPLYYELTGIEPLPAVPGVLGIRGTVNSGAKAKNFAPNLSPKIYQAMPAPGNGDVILLVVPYKGPSGDYNPWHYQSSKPEHNTEGFDLWAEVTINGKTEIIPNWKD